MSPHAGARNQRWAAEVLSKDRALSTSKNTEKSPNMNILPQFGGDVGGRGGDSECFEFKPTTDLLKSAKNAWTQYKAQL